MRISLLTAITSASYTAADNVLCHASAFSVACDVSHRRAAPIVAGAADVASLPRLCGQSGRLAAGPAAAPAGPAAAPAGPAAAPAGPAAAAGAQLALETPRAPPADGRWPPRASDGAAESRAAENPTREGGGEVK